MENFYHKTFILFTHYKYLPNQDEKNYFMSIKIHAFPFKK